MAQQMTTLARLTAPDGDPWLGRFALPGHTWWLLRDDSRERLGNAVADFVVRATERPRESAWVMQLKGTRSGIRYVSEAPTATVPPGATTGLLAPLRPDAVVEALDRAETAQVSVLLLLADLADMPAAIESLRDAAGSEPASRPALPIVLLTEAGRPWAVIGVLGDERAPVPGVPVQGMEPWPDAARPTAGSGSARHVSPRRRVVVVAALLAAVGIVAMGSWLRLRGANAPAPRSTSRAAIAALAPAIPEPSSTPSIAFDGGDRSVVLFGGGEPAGTTWLWSKQSWGAATPHASPSDRFGSAMAYDPLLQRMLLFGGREMPGGVPNDTWAWDGRTWTRLVASGTGPPGFEFSGMAWDDSHQQMVLVTPPGSGAGTASAVTWTWSGRGWTQRLSPRAPPVAGNTLAFDPATRTVLLVVAPSSAAASTWSWDGTTWRDLHPLHSPTLLGPTFMEAVPGSKQLILITVSDSASESPQTWLWDGRDWTQQHPLLTPSGIAGLASDDGSGAVIAFGRVGGVGQLNAAWAWAGTQWARLAMPFPAPPVDVASQHPSPRVSASTAYDERHQNLVLFGGRLEETFLCCSPTAPFPSPTFDTDTWTFDGQRWARWPTFTHPPSTGSMAFDTVTDSVILVADANGSGFLGPGLARPVTWSWDGRTWRRLHPASELPLGTVPIAMAADPAMRMVVAVAICCQDSNGDNQPPQSLSTWVWNGHTWRNPHPRVELGPGAAVSLAYDTASREVLAVLSNGSNGTATTWAWGGGSWTELPAHIGTVDPATAVMGNDPANGTMVLLESQFQDRVSGAIFGGTQVWDGTAWIAHHDLALPGAHTAAGGAVLYDDPRIGRLVVIGSSAQDLFQDFSQMWMWTGASWLQLTIA